MKQRILLLFVMTAFITSIHAQNDKKKEKKVTGYAITAAEKGGKNWKEVRFVDVNSGDELKSIYQSAGEMEALNARTGKPVVKKAVTPAETKTITKTVSSTTPSPVAKKVVNLDDELGNGTAKREIHRVVIVRHNAEPTDKPFATNSAAMAYDKKHERLYYTPMGINQLRYIDLKSKSPRIYYFEEEAFGVVKGMGDVANQITRMTFASDGNGYALSNDGNHLIRFTTGKKPQITDLGPLSDEASNGEYTVHSNRMYGGDMIADASGNLYVIAASHHVFKVNIESRNAKYLGTIKGLPQGFSTNGAMVEEDSKVIIASSQSTAGYYRFDLNTLNAEKVSSSNQVFNASDLANGNLAFEKKKKETKEEETVAKSPVAAETAKPSPAEEEIAGKGIAVYPNPVSNGMVRLDFAGQPAGKYQVQLVDLSGRVISTKEVNIGSSKQIEEFRLPEQVAKGNYLVKIFNDANKVSVTNKLVVQ